MNVGARWLVWIQLIACALTNTACRCKDTRNFTIVNHTDRVLDCLFVPDAIPCRWAAIRSDKLYRVWLKPGDRFEVARALPGQVKHYKATCVVSYLYAREVWEDCVHIVAFDWWDPEKLSLPQVLMQKARSVKDDSFELEITGNFRDRRTVDLKGTQHVEIFQRFWGMVPSEHNTAFPR